MQAPQNIPEDGGRYRAGLVRHLDSVDAVLELFEKDLVADEMRDLFHLDGIEYLWTSDGYMMPSIASPFASPFLYRGQTRRHQPCLPNVFRGLPVDWAQDDGFGSLPLPDRLRLVVERVRLGEFVLALSDHPACAYAREIGLRLHPEALAQHYELATDRVDLTQDHMVAAFFATNVRTNEGWTPANTGTGVMYRLLAKPFHEHMKEHLVCIGKQTFPRPGEQKAHTLTLPLGCDFESLPIEIYTFPQDQSCGARLNDRFNGGASLFPPDVLAEVAEAIRLERSIPDRIAVWFLVKDGPCRDLLGVSPEQLETLLSQHSDVRMSARDRITLTASQHERAAMAVKTMKSTFLNKVGALAVCRTGAEFEERSE